MKYIILICCFVIFACQTNAQNELAGRVFDAATGEELIGATINVLEVNKVIKSFSTDFDGNFNIPFSGDRYSLDISYPGYKSRRMDQVNRQEKLLIALEYQDEEKSTVVEVGCFCYGLSIKPGISDNSVLALADSMILKSQTNSSTATPAPPIDFIPELIITGNLYCTRGSTISDYLKTGESEKALNSAEGSAASDEATFFAAPVSIILYPNPAIELLTIDLGDHSDKMWIIDYQGRVVLEQYHLIAGKHVLQIHQLFPGIYFINFLTGRKVVTKKLVVQATE